MKGDFTRLTFHREKHFSHVLRQQGRVTLDADDNEQTAILLHYLRALAEDLIGPYAAPTNGGGFALGVNSKKDGFTLSAGRYYVDGILVENEAEYDVAGTWLGDVKRSDQPVWLYLDVWERHITSIDDDTIREAALNGPDTCTRAQVTWQVKGLSVLQAFDDRIALLKDPDAKSEFTKALQQFKAAYEAAKTKDGAPAMLCGDPMILLDGLSRANMIAQVDPGPKPDDPCVLPPDAKYRGMENQLYRVEIHRGGRVGDQQPPTLKWSRDNGSVVTAWLGGEGADLKVACGRGFTSGNWVELFHDDMELAGQPGSLARISKVDGNTLSLDAAPAFDWSPQLMHPTVRRWDQVQRDDIVLDDGAVLIQESPLDATGSSITWIDLEDGVQVAFAVGGQYRTGDYWLIPARVATGSIEWPTLTWKPPFGIQHHFAPLGFVSWNGDGPQLQACRCTFAPGTSCLEAATVVRPKPRIEVALQPAPVPRASVRRRRG